MNRADGTTMEGRSNGFRAELDALSVDHNLASSTGRSRLLDLVKSALVESRDEARRRLEANGKGLDCARYLARAQDRIIRSLFEVAVEQIFPIGNPSAAERLSIAAVGGYGRETLAPGSDIDLLFLFPYKETPWSESVTEFVLYMLWDAGLKVGHATRNATECVRSAREDITIRTALLESRFLCGDSDLFDGFWSKFDNEVIAGTANEFIAAKLAERDQRHRRAGSSRYLVEPNVKEGKGGLRDLQTLYWLAKYSYRAKRGGVALIEAGLLSSREQRLFSKCEDFLWAVRCHMHFLTGRAEERVSFDLQPELAAQLGYQKHPGLRAVERFMKHYFITAKNVGDLTRIVCAELEEREAKKGQGLNRFLKGLTARRRKLRESEDFFVDAGRINVVDDTVFEQDSVNLLRLFRLAGRNNLAFHPDAMRLVTNSLRLVDRNLQNNEEANKLFLDILTAKANSEIVLRRMNEAGLLGRFIPDFGKIVAMMQFSMYHHYTVDEHLLRAVGILAEVDSGKRGDEHPLTHEILPGIKDKVPLYVAMFLHDIAKGRPEDHSIAGARVARKLCPRFGLTPKQTELVVWLVEHHLTMSIVAQSRDLADRKTILDFAEVVESMERLKYLLVLTVCDIRAVGPGVWNGWKGQLLRTLYYETEPILTGGFSTATREQKVAFARSELSDRLSRWANRDRDAILRLHYPAYWLRVDTETQFRNAELIRDADLRKQSFAWAVKPMEFEAATEITVVVPDHPRLLTTIAGACAAVEANIVGAQIFTMTDGRALDTIIISRAFDRDEDELRRAERIAGLIEKGLAGEILMPDAMAKKIRSRARRDAFSIVPTVTVENEFSNRFTVVEVSCIDRVGLLHDLTRTLADLNVDIASAQIATFGERVRDTFYVTDLVGEKITAAPRKKRIRDTLLSVIDPGDSAGKGARARPKSGSTGATKQPIKSTSRRARAPKST